MNIGHDIFRIGQAGAVDGCWKNGINGSGCNGWLVVGAKILEKCGGGAQREEAERKEARDEVRSFHCGGMGRIKGREVRKVVFCPKNFVKKYEIFGVKNFLLLNE